MLTDGKNVAQVQGYCCFELVLVHLEGSFFIIKKKVSQERSFKKHSALLNWLLRVFFFFWRKLDLLLFPLLNKLVKYFNKKAFFLVLLST